MAETRNTPKGGTLARKPKPRQVVTEGAKQGEKTIEKSLKKLTADNSDKHDWSEDLVSGAKSAGSAGKKAFDVATDVLIDKDAWKRTAAAISDGPGGQEIRGRDLANMALDATTVVPGVGLAGAAARVGARSALKLGAREAAEAAAPKLTGMAARVAERKAAGSGARVAGRDTTAAAGKHRGAAGVGSGKSVGARSNKAGESSTLGRLLNEGGSVGRGGLESVATRQTRALAGDKSARILAGKGTRVGFNQTKRRIGANALLAGGLNLGASGYNALMNGGGPGLETGPDGVVDLSGGGPGSVGYYFVDASGEATSIPDSVAKTLAANYQNMGGSPDGSQVIYLGR